MRVLETIRLAGVISESYTDGVGIRYVIFTQGCNHHCKNCHNPETWSFEDGNEYNIDKLVDIINQNPMLDGVTISGGDPMYRPDETLNLIKAIRNKTKLNIWVYTGYTWEECLADSKKIDILNNIDILVDGPYMEELRSLHLRFRGSSNQRIIDVQKSLKSGNIIQAIID